MTYSNSREFKSRISMKYNVSFTLFEAFQILDLFYLFLGYIKELLEIYCKKTEKKNDYIKGIGSPP